MNIVILHCHFERGGVTQVVENHVRWLRESESVGRIVLVSGERAGGLSDSTLQSVERLVVQGFDYDAEVFGKESLGPCRQQLAQDLSHSLEGIGVSADDAVLHWHNHSLGKNTAAPGVVGDLAQAGWRVLLQIHDFAEDNRPQNYQRLIQASGSISKAEIDGYLYPVASQIHYATLTRADAAVLSRLGVSEHRTHCLPNSVVLPGGDLPTKEDALAKVRKAMNLPEEASWSVYPVRGIRRKNVGEFLLLSRWTREYQFSGVTLCPATPVEERSYRRWEKIAGDVAPRAVFDAGHAPSITLADNLSAADFIVSTSVAEGFGMALLEPWLVGRPVIARRLPTVTGDFEDTGVRLPCLYDAIPIPGDPDWIKACLAETQAAMTDAWSMLEPEFRPCLDADQESVSDSVDFASLRPTRQIEVLQRMATDAGFESAAMQRSSELVAYLSEPSDEGLVQHNREVVQTQYSPECTGSTLLGIYETLLAEPLERAIHVPKDVGSGVDLINRQRPFYPCRTEWIDE